ncbi:uncharacterized protein LAJ45_11588 [Morchella importuna]|uniref:peptidylprolyl isomerase n=1 Tax=Morchella conica CCBAS932 TaxID=1392247 RepID=A0A3N4KPM0_9PEZI|nr:uncharacterized protein LAJ45_11588 [Morchella importuna]KAH8144420.1 hypothetical protein LAJ45_11588 [Morchella importuna]RPB11418.1 FKBP-type peptidyl-prolyl cis-trans isomerase [Morchella conica CCBAS932]
MRVSTIISLVVSALVASATAEELKIEKVKEIECVRKTKAGDTIQVHYRGTLEDGTEFDASYNRGQPFVFQLGQGRVIKGWDQGLLDMCIGDERKLTIPYDLAYGERGMPPVIPPKATLIFQTELLGIQGYTPEKVEL